ncbi:hypothetical protein JW905_13620, partial [bacterium]|nr:hypothetical protein [candidate division CSSED10-310 bacterium]
MAAPGPVAVDAGAAVGWDEAVFTGDEEGEFDRLLMQLGMAREDGDYDAALAVTDRLAEYRERFAANRLWYSRGLAALASGREEQAGEIFSHGIGEHSGPPGLRECAAYHLARCQESSGRWSRAAAAWEDVLAHPAPFFDKTAIRLRAADCRRAAGEYDAAMCHYRACLSKVRSKGARQSVQLAMADVFSDLGQVAAAFTNYRQVLEIDAGGLSGLRALNGMVRLQPALELKGVRPLPRSLAAMARATYYGGEFTVAEKRLRAALRAGLRRDDRI